MTLYSGVLTATVTCSVFFFFNDTATTEIYTLSLHDALPILGRALRRHLHGGVPPRASGAHCPSLCVSRDRKSTRLNSSHANISYAVFCLKKKNISPKTVSSRSSQPHSPPTPVSTSVCPM